MYYRDEPGSVIADKYELLAPAGKGGMATVWRATARGAAGFERAVAVKRILPDLNANAEFVTMFVEEARVGSQLTHPHVVQIIDFGADEIGAYYLVMEWVEGLDLGRYLAAFRHANQPGPWPLLVAITIEVLRGLSAAHERVEGAIIHRDINPQNILVGDNGIAKLSDFGLSRAMDRARMTRPDVVKGKLSYLAPELTHGSEPTVQTDVFAAGIVLWEALSGRRLFEAQTDIDVLLMVREAKVPPLRELRPDLPEGLHRAVQTALAKDPSWRFGSAYDFADALAKVLRQVSTKTDYRAIGNSIRQVVEWLGEGRGPARR